MKHASVEAGCELHRTRCCTALTRVFIWDTRNPQRPFDSEHASTEAGCELHRTRCSTALTCVLQCSEARTGCFTSRAESLRRLRLLATKSPMNEAHGTTLLHFKLQIFKHHQGQNPGSTALFHLLQMVVKLQTSTRHPDEQIHGRSGALCLSSTTDHDRQAIA